LPSSDTGASRSLTPNESRGGGGAERPAEVAALATGLKMVKIPVASANTMKLIERRTFSPWLLGPGPRRSPDHVRQRN